MGEVEEVARKISHSKLEYTIKVTGSCSTRGSSSSYSDLDTYRLVKSTVDTVKVAQER